VGVAVDWRFGCINQTRDKIRTIVILAEKVMTATQVKDLSLDDVIKKFGLVETTDPDFFAECQGPFTEITASARQELAQIESDYTYLSHRSMDEGAVKLVVIGRLLGLAGYYQAPFSLVTEKTVKLKAIDDGQTLRGVVDILAMHEKVWVLLVEAKRNAFSIEPALPQALAYMSGAPYPEYPTFGLITNGRNYLFIKLLNNTYGLSKDYSLRNPGDLITVLQVMKHLGEVVKTWPTVG
jgi:hypothetical protein